MPLNSDYKPRYIEKIGKICYNQRATVRNFINRTFHTEGVHKAVLLAKIGHHKREKCRGKRRYTALFANNEWYLNEDIHVL